MGGFYFAQLERKVLFVKFYLTFYLQKCRICIEVILLKVLEILEEKKRKKELKYVELAKYLGITKQCFSKHLKKLRKGKISFSALQIQKICSFLNEDISIFFDH